WDQDRVPCRLVAGGCEQSTATAPTLPVAAPSQGIEVGDNVTLRCHLPRPAAWVQLCQEGGFTPCMKKYNVQDMAVFSFAVTKWVHTGTYRCQYRVSEPAETSEKSDPVELVVTGECTGVRGIPELSS
ncbi:leukocyte immunoglobulin-like receptor subfamily A member 2, partial [Meleagris gallopavo]|uniref:leukocyte immunoglobulin-like receptor subfamily A member 2 n=1 Tax=Meleagris gallopavo TaxID=9103 RepID=UPI00093B7925